MKMSSKPTTAMSSRHRDAGVAQRGHRADRHQIVGGEEGARPIRPGEHARGRGSAADLVEFGAGDDVGLRVRAPPAPADSLPRAPLEGRPARRAWRSSMPALDEKAGRRGRGGAVVDEQIVDRQDARLLEGRTRPERRPRRRRSGDEIHSACSVKKTPITPSTRPSMPHRRIRRSDSRCPAVLRVITS